MESGFSLKKSKPWKEERLGRALRSWIKIRSIGLIAWIFKNMLTDRCRSRYRCVYTHESSSHGHSEWPIWCLHTRLHSKETEALKK